jgi:hypothetical protein
LRIHSKPVPALAGGPSYKGGKRMLAGEPLEVITGNFTGDNGPCGKPKSRTQEANPRISIGAGAIGELLCKSRSVGMV